MVQTFNLGETKYTNFNSNPVKVLQLNGVNIWEYSSIDWIDGDDRFYYTGIDANGVMEDAIGYTGTPVEYALGKRQRTMFTLVSPTPTSQSGYIGKYLNATGTELTESLVSTYVSNGTIVVGETPCYKTTTDINEVASQSDIRYSYPDCNALNPSYYNGEYKDEEFFPSKKSDGNNALVQVLPSEPLFIPNRYNGKPIIRIFAKAFRNGYEGSQSESDTINQTNYITELNIPEGIVYFGDDVFYRLNLPITFPNTTKSIGADTCKYNNTYVEIGENVEEILGFIKSAGSVQGKCVYKAINSTLPNVNGVFSYFDTVIFESSVKVLAGRIFYISDASPTKVVFTHGEDDVIDLNITAPKSAMPLTIYTDNTMVKNYDWAGANYTVTFYPLSEYVES